MNTLFVGDNAVLQGPQNDPDFVIMGTNSTFISTAADTIFAGAGHSTIYDTGVSGPNGFTGDTVVLGAGSATVLIGGVGSKIYAGTGEADIFYTNTPGQLVTGSGGTLNVVGNPNGVGISYTGGIASISHDSAGNHILTGMGEHVNLFAAGPVA